MKDVKFEIGYPVDFDSPIVEVFYKTECIFVIHFYENEFKIRFFAKNSNYKEDLSIDLIKKLIDYSVNFFLERKLDK